VIKYHKRISHKCCWNILTSLAVSTGLITFVGFDRLYGVLPEYIPIENSADIDGTTEDTIKKIAIKCDLFLIHVNRNFRTILFFTPDRILILIVNCAINTPTNGEYNLLNLLDKYNSDGNRFRIRKIYSYYRMMFPLLLLIISCPPLILLGQIAACLAHEICNPIASIGVHANVRRFIDNCVNNATIISKKREVPSGG
jgi:hypothetical protein